MLEHIHPADRATSSGAFAAGDRRYAAAALRAPRVWADGSIHWISAHGSLYRSAGRTTA